MIVVHHLNDSRSQRMLWLLDEFGLPYEIKRYQRDAQTRLAPRELTGIGIQMSFVGEVTGSRGNRGNHPHLDAWVKRSRSRPAYRRAIERGGAYIHAR